MDSSQPEYSHYTFHSLYLPISQQYSQFDVGAGEELGQLRSTTFNDSAAGLMPERIPVFQSEISFPVGIESTLNTTNRFDPMFFNPSLIHHENTVLIADSLPDTDVRPRYPFVSSVSEGYHKTRTRRILSPVNGNNTTGKRGKLRCMECRRRHSKVPTI
jgi:hypothetical protein